MYIRKKCLLFVIGIRGKTYKWQFFKFKDVILLFVAALKFRKIKNNIVVKNIQIYYAWGSANYTYIGLLMNEHFAQNLNEFRYLHGSDIEFTFNVTIASKIPIKIQKTGGLRVQYTYYILIQQSSDTSPQYTLLTIIS